MLRRHAFGVLDTSHLRIPESSSPDSAIENHFATRFINA
jgi:hypothetical protein